MGFMNYQMRNTIFSPFKTDWSVKFFQPTIFFLFFPLKIKGRKEKEEEGNKGLGVGGKEKKKKEEEEKKNREEEIAGTQNKSLIIKCFPNSFRIMVASL